MQQVLTLFSVPLPQLVASFLAFTVAVTVHQFGHALVAQRAGDPEPILQRARTLNPLVHLHWIGMFMFTFLGFGIFTGAPVSHFRILDEEAAPQKANETDEVASVQQAELGEIISAREQQRLAEEAILRDAMPELFTHDVAHEWHGYKERQDFIAALLAGPLTNLIVGIIFITITRQQQLAPTDFAAPVLNQMIIFNFFFFVMSFLPLPPMDGWLALLAFLPRERAVKLKEHELNLCYALAALIILHFLIAADLFGLPVEFDVIDTVVGSPARILRSTFMG